MISRLKGEILETADNRVELRQGAAVFELLIPTYLERPMAAARGEEVELYTHFYLEGGPGAATMVPRLIGFPTASDRDFFHQLTKVPGLGAKSALKAMVVAPGEIARAIEGSDKSALSHLPGIGGRTAEKVIAALRGKVTRFAAGGAPAAVAGPTLAEPEEEALAVLMQLAYRRPEAEELIRKVQKKNPGLATAEAIVQAVLREAGSGFVK